MGVVLVIETYTRRLFDKMVRLYDKKDSNFEILKTYLFSIGQY